MMLILMKKSFVGGPTCNIAGLISGYTGEGSKTILPSKAMAKLDFRLVPNMVPKSNFKSFEITLIELALLI